MFFKAPSGHFLSRQALIFLVSLLQVRAIMKYREPGVLIVQVIIPILYSCIGLLMNSLQSGQTSAIDDPLNISSTTLYLNSGDEPYYSFRNLTNGPLTDFEQHMLPTPLLNLESADYLDLLESKQVAFFNVSKSIR